MSQTPHLWSSTNISLCKRGSGNSEQIQHKSVSFSFVGNRFFFQFNTNKIAN